MLSWWIVLLWTRKLQKPEAIRHRVYRYVFLYRAKKGRSLTGFFLPDDFILTEVKMFQSLDDLLKILNPQIVASLKRAIELGKWPDGRALTTGQRTLCGEAVAHWEQRYCDPEAQVGYVPPKSEPCGSKHDHEAVTWVDS